MASPQAAASAWFEKEIDYWRRNKPAIGSLAIPGIFFNVLNQRKYGFLDTTLHPSVERAYHAVSIDERRAQF